MAAAISVFPCRCVPASLQDYYGRADSVVTARVISVSTSTEGEKLTTAKVEITDVWKKLLPGQIEVITGSSCLYNMQAGEKHLLYLQTASEGKYSTMQCQGNLPLKKAQKSLNWLKKYGKKSLAVFDSIYFPDFFEERLGDILFEVRPNEWI